MLTIRPFEGTDDDYEAMIIVDSAVFADFKMSVEEWRHLDNTRDPSRFFRREMIERNGKVVAFGDYGQATDPQKVTFHVTVHPDHDRPDIRPAYLDHVLEKLAGRSPLTLLSGALDDHPKDMRFLEQSGFMVTMREQSSELDVASFDESRFAELRHRITKAGIQIISLGELGDQDPGWKKKLYDLFWDLVQDVPSTVPHVRRSIEDFEETHLSGPSFNPDCWFVALKGETYVGMSRARVNQVDAEQLDSGLTAVSRAFRRQGIATALKLSVIAYARGVGVKRIVSFNEEGNPMFLLNLSLGFVPKPAWVTFEKVLR